MKRITTLAALLLAFTMTGCAESNKSDESDATETFTTEDGESFTVDDADTDGELSREEIAEAAFLTAVKRDTTSFVGVPDSLMIETAESGCSVFDAGGTFYQLASIAMEAMPEASPTDIGYFIGAGTTAFCPEHESLLGQ